MSGSFADEGQHDNWGREPLAGSRPAASRDWPSEVSELYVAHYGSLLRFAMRIVHNDRQLAEDAVQSSFLQFLIARPSLENLENALSYLRVTVRHAALRALTAERNQKHVPYEERYFGLPGALPGALASAEEEALANSGIGDVADVLRGLPQRQRDVLTLAAQGFQPAEIASALGIEPNAARVSLHHARAKMQAWLTADSAAAA